MIQLDPAQEALNLIARGCYDSHKDLLHLWLLVIYRGTDDQIVTARTFVREAGL